MGIFDRLFARSGLHTSPEPDVQLNFPYETVMLPGAEAVAHCLRLREEGAGQFTPIILGNPKSLNILLEGFEEMASTPQSHIDLAEEITTASFVEKRLAQEEEYYQDIEVGEWPDGVAASQQLTGHTNILTGVPLNKVAICKVPTPRSWEVPAYFSFGAWNECPAPEEHVALLRYWHEAYGADIISLSSDVLECTVSHPPADREQALALAREQFVYCSDIVYQGTETLSALAASLCKGKTWFFWWD